MPVRATGPLRGFTLSPRTFEGTDFTEFFDLAARHGDAVGRVSDILEWGDRDSALAVVDLLAEEYGYLSISITGVSSTETGHLLRPIDDTAFDALVAAATTYAQRVRPPYLGLGVEVDTLYAADPAGFERFVDLFDAVATEVHRVSPNTGMLTVFQLERMSGNHSGIFGGVDDPGQATWELIDRFPNADVIGFSTYPGLVHPSPDDIPDDYYRRLADRTGDRPIAFTEMGWHAAGDYGPYSGSEEKQARYVERFPELIWGLDVEFYLWAFLFDQPAHEPFDTMGLLRSDGTARAAWDVWTASD